MYQKIIYPLHTHIFIEKKMYFFSVFMALFDSTLLQGINTQTY